MFVSRHPNFTLLFKVESFMIRFKNVASPAPKNPRIDPSFCQFIKSSLVVELKKLKNPAKKNDIKITHTKNKFFVKYLKISKGFDLPHKNQELSVTLFHIIRVNMIKSLIPII